MDATAINAIQKLAFSEEGNLALKGADNLAVIVPEAFKLQSLEALNNRPNLFRGTFATTVIADFVKYINDNASNDSAIFIDKDDMFAKTIIDFGTSDEPQWGKHIARAVLKKSPAYAALLNFNDVTLSQQSLIDFAEDWQEQLTFVDADSKPLEFKKTINTLRRIKVDANLSAEQNIGNFSASRSTLEQVEIKAGQDVLPAGFIFGCIPYEGFQLHQFSVQIRAINHEKEVKLKYRVSQLEAHQTAIADEFRKIIIDTVDGDTVQGVCIYLGNMTYQS